MRSGVRSAAAARMRCSTLATAAFSTSAMSELVAIEIARLVGLDDRRLGKRRLLPFANVGMREQRFEVCPRGAGRLYRVGLEAKRDRRVEAVGDRIAAAEKRAVRAEAASRFVPYSRDALDVRSKTARPRAYVDALANAHRHLASQRREARVHFGGDRARPGASAQIVGPHLAIALGQMQRDR